MADSLVTLMDKIVKAFMGLWTAGLHEPEEAIIPIAGKLKDIVCQMVDNYIAVAGETVYHFYPSHLLALAGNSLFSQVAPTGLPS